MYIRQLRVRERETQKKSGAESGKKCTDILLESKINLGGVNVHGEKEDIFYML